VAEIVDKLRESRLRYLGHNMRRGDSEAVGDVFEINIDGKVRRERPKKKLLHRIEINNNKEV